MVNIVAENRGDGHGEQREHGEDGLSRTAHVTHPAIDNQCHDSQSHQTNFSGFILGKVAGERAHRHGQHDNVLDDGHRAAAPEGVDVGLCKREVALQHVHGIFLEREDGAVIEHAKQSHQPETTGGEDLADIGHFERIVLLFSLTGLSIQFFVHEEVNDEHHQGNAEEHHAERHRTGNVNRAAQFGEEGGEDHAGGDTQTGKGHLRTHSQSSLTTFEPFHDTAGNGNTGHFHTATENHETDGCNFGGSGHSLIEWSHAKFLETGDVIEVVGEPSFHTAAHKGLRNGIVLNQTTDKHYGTGQYCRKSHTHLVEDNTREDEEENEHVQERLRTLHGTKSGGIPTSCRLHQILDGRKDVHENVGTEHGQSQQQQRCPSHGRAVSQSL